MKNLVNLKKNILPWCYTILVGLGLVLYFAVPLYFKENVGHLTVTSSCSRIRRQDGHLRLLELKSSSVQFAFDWLSNVTIQTISEQKRVLPQSYTVQKNNVIIQFAPNINFVFSNKDKDFFINAEIPVGTTLSLPWNFVHNYQFKKENPGYFYITDKTGSKRLFEITSALEHVEIGPSKLVFYGEDTIKIEPIT